VANPRADAYPYRPLTYGDQVRRCPDCLGLKGLWKILDGPEPSAVLCWTCRGSGQVIITRDYTGKKIVGQRPRQPDKIIL
jgi:hypothetical protein